MSMKNVNHGESRGNGPSRSTDSAFSDLRKSRRVWGESLEEGLSDPHLYRCGSPPSEWTHERCGVKRLSFRFHPS